jgi:hypothetical protein
MSRFAYHDYVIINVWRTWTYSGAQGGGAQDATTIASTIKSYNPNIKVIEYVNINDASESRQISIEPYITFSNDGDPNNGGKGTDERWWLYDGSGFVYPDDVAFPDRNAPFPSAQINGGSNSKDAAGLYCAQWWARAFHANSTDAGDWVTSGYGFRSEYGYDGIFQDIMRHRPRTNGDFNEDGTNDDNESVIAYTFKSQQDQRFQAEWALLEPDHERHGNMTYNAGTGGGTVQLDQYNTALTYGYQNLVHGCHMERIMGGGSSPETWGGFNTMMLYYKRMMTLNEGMDPQVTYFDCHIDDDDGSTQWGGSYTIYDFGRYGLCCCLQDNGYFGYIWDGYIECQILDEYSFNLGAALTAPNYDGNDPATSIAGSGYNPYQDGVYLREFENGLAIVNPKNNGTQTITLPSPGSGYQWDRLDAANYANQDPDVNTGELDISSVTLPERHGIIIKRTPLYWPEQNVVSYLPAVRNRNSPNAPVVAAGRGYGMDTRHAYEDWPAFNPTVVHVTNLNSTGAGSFHDALENAADRTIIVFDVAGKIICDAQISVTASKIWVAGQTAPGLVWVQFTDTEELVRITTGTEIMRLKSTPVDRCSRISLSIIASLVAVATKFSPLIIEPI